MTKRLIIGLVAIAMFMLVVMVPVSAVRVNTGPDYYYDYYYNVSSKIGSGATVFLGEDHLNLVGIAPNTLVGFWPSGTPSGPPAKSDIHHNPWRRFNRSFSL